MYAKNILWTTSGVGKILRILSYENDTSVLYSWQPNDRSKESSVTYIRLFNPSNDTDKVVLISKNSGEFVSASISVGHHAIAFTVWISQQDTESRTFEVITTNHPKFKEYCAQDILDACPLRTHALESNISILSGEETVPKSLFGNANVHATRQRGIYKSYLAHVFPSAWSFKFETERRLKQRVIFTNFLQRRTKGDINLTQYELILAMNKENIGLYNLVLEHERDVTSRSSSVSSSSNGQTRIPSNDHSISSDFAHQCKLFDKPSSEMLSNKLLWCQWEPSTQRLYYLTPTLDFPNKIKLVCYQFYASLLRQRVMDIPLDMGLSRHALTNKSSLNYHREVDPTLASFELNIRVCVFNETGTMCLCWQEMKSQDVTPTWAYSVAILNKDVVIRRKYLSTSSTIPVSFSIIGSNLLVHCPGSYLDVYDVESISCDYEHVSNGLYHMSLPDEYFRSFAGEALEHLLPEVTMDDSTKFSSTLDDSIVSDSIDSLSSSSSDSLYSSSIFYDRSSSSFVSIQFDAEEFGNLLSEERLSIQNKIFLTRQAVLSTKGHASSTGALMKVFENIMRHPTDPSVTGIIAQLLIATSCMDIFEHQHNVPPAMKSLFPTSLPASALGKLVPQKNDSDEDIVYSFIDIRGKIKQEVEQYATIVSTVHKLLPSTKRSLSFDHDALRRDRSESNPSYVTSSSHEIKDSLWFRTLSACESGTFTEYDLECIHEELIILQRSYKHPGGQDTGKVPHEFSMLRERLTKLFRKNFLQMTVSSENLLESCSGLVTPESLSFLNESERDRKSENVMVLTSEKLCDHLTAHYRHESESLISASDAEQFSRDYVLAQVRQSHHNLALIMMKSEVENFERALSTPASSREHDLLSALNQFQLVCHITCFPLPNGFHTFIACLTFRCLLARFSFFDEGHEEINMELLSELFFDYVDKGLVQLTNDFVARSLEELGNIIEFSVIVEEVLIRTRGLKNDDISTLGGLEQWRHPKAKIHLARAHLKKFYKNESAPESSTRASRRGTSRSRSYSGTNTNTEKQTVPSLLKELEDESLGRRRSGSAGSRRRRHLPEFDTGFQPLDALLEFVGRSEEKNLNGKMLSRKTSNLPIADIVRSAVLET